ncbi:MAG TPA: DNA polymerase III subunit delta [Desulfomonilia bacterium]|nr:DNA polymerase III subunit delta [Desulfomonilia bacterium]
MNALKSGKTFQNAVFTGQETFLMEEELSHLKLQLGDNASMNLAVFNADEGLSMDEVLGLCNTLPFLSEKRGIVVRNSHKLTAKQLDQAIAYLENPCETTTFILVMEAEKTDKDLAKLLKRFDGKASIIRFEAIKNRSERLSWIMDRALLHGKKIDKDAAVLLAEMAGSSMWYLDSEIQKLSLYVADNSSITTKDVQEVVMRTYEPAIFAFLDALFDRKRDTLSRLYDLELAGVAELEIISRIENQIINHYVVLSGRDWKKMKIHDFIAERALKRKPLWSTTQLLILLKEIRQIEQKLKSSSLTHIYAALTEAIGRHVLPPRTEGRIPLRP